MIKSRIARKSDENSSRLADRADTLSRVTVQAASFLIWGIGLVMIMSQLGIDIGPILASIGVIALGISFAAQNLIRDFINGFFILMEDWYREGEVAVIEGTGGLVEKITIRRTILRDLDGAMHIFPNGVVQKASNLTRDWSRINLIIGVGYNENLTRVIKVINDVCKKFKEDPDWGGDMLTTPHVERVNNLGDSAVVIMILGDTRPIKQWSLMGELRKRIKDRFDEENIEIPWPHTKVYFGNAIPAGSEK